MGIEFLKPEMIHQYTRNMSGIDLSDQYMAFHMSLHKSMIVVAKTFFHLLNMILINSYLLNKKFGNNKLSHDDYIEYISNYLIDSTLVDRFSLFQQRTIWTNTNKQRICQTAFCSENTQRSYQKKGIPIQYAKHATSQVVKWSTLDLNPDNSLGKQQHIGVCHVKFHYVSPCVLRFITLLMNTMLIFS